MDFAPLVEVAGVTFYSLQKGAAADQAIRPSSGMTVINLDEHLSDFAETAAAIANLDLVISVDTSVAHLAGALGKPVWTLLPYSPDWRWFLVRDDSPWYPTMRLFRQERCGDWESVFRRVADALRRWIQERKPAQTYRPPLSIADAEQSFQQGRHEEAELLCRRIIDEQPNHVDALHLLGNILFQAGLIDEAIGYFEHAARVRPGQAVLHFNLGVASARLGRRDEAAASYRRALAVEPQYPEGHFNLANLCRDRGQIEDAVRHYLDAVAANPDYLKARNNLGTLLLRTGQFEEAITQFQEVLKARPENAKAMFNIALVFQKKGAIQMALEHARRAAALEPQSPEFQEGLAIIWQEIGNAEDATACRDRAAALRSIAATSS